MISGGTSANGACSSPAPVTAANDAGAATLTSWPASRHATQNGISGPKWPDPAVVETNTRIGRHAPTRR